jgi:hypothetical protein
MSKRIVLFVLSALAGIAAGALWAFHLLGGVK